MKGMKGSMKKKFLLLLCVGMMLTGCADQKPGKQEEPEVYSLDLGGQVQEKETGENQASTVVGAVQTEEDAAQQKQSEEDIFKEDTSEEDSFKEGAQQEAPERVSDGGSTSDNKNAQDLYTQFLNNEVSVTVGGAYSQNEYRANNLERGRAYTFAELGQYVNQSYFNPEYDEKTTYDYAQYTYVGCPDSDSRNLLVKFVGLDIYSPGDDSFVFYVVTQSNGQLYLTDEYECWARSLAEPYRNGLCSTYGSNGAEDHYSGMLAILSNGIETSIYDTEIVSGWCVRYVDETIYHEFFDENADVPLVVSIYSVGEEKYYLYDLSQCTDEQKTLCEAYIDRCRDEAGINWVTDKQLQDAICERCSAIGVVYDMLEQKGMVEWHQI